MAITIFSFYFRLIIEKVAEIAHNSNLPDLKIFDGINAEVNRYMNTNIVAVS